MWGGGGGKNFLWSILMGGGGVTFFKRVISANFVLPELNTRIVTVVGPQQ